MWFDAPADTRELSVDLRQGPLDDRIARFSQLESLSIRCAAEDLALPEALRALPRLRSLQQRGPRDVRVRFPALLAELPLTHLDLDNPEVAGLQLPDALEALVLWSRSSAADLEDLCPRLPRLRRLEVHDEGERSKEWAQPIPSAIAACAALESLELYRFDGALPPALEALTALRRLAVSTMDLPQTVRRIAAHLPGIEELTLAGRDTTSEVPAELGALARLRALTISHHEVTELPASMAALTSLQHLHLAKLKNGALPEVVGALPALEVLTLNSVNTLPAGLAALKTLKKLVLRDALNKGPLVSRYDDLDRLKPLPKVLSELVSLEELDLHNCGVFDIEPLRTLTKLRRLDLGWSAISDLSPLAALTRLEILDLEHADRVRDLSPLAALRALEELNLEDTRPRDLEVLRSLPALRKLNIESIETKELAAVYERDLELQADEGVLSRYARRAELRKLPPIAAVAADLKSDDLAVVERALEHLATWTLASSTREANAITAALGLGPAPTAEAEGDDEDQSDEDVEDLEDESGDDEGGHDDDEEWAAYGAPSGDRTLPPLDAALDRHLPAIRPMVLAQLFRALFQRMEADYTAAARVAEEVARRADDQAQALIVEAFEQASEYYDTGHRMWEDTVQDRLIEEIFPAFGGRALTKLLTTVSDGHLSEDGMEALFVPALERASGEDRGALFARLERYVVERLPYLELEALDALWAQLAQLESPEARAGLEAVKARLAAQLAAHREKEALEADLRAHEEPARVKAALLRVAAFEKPELDDVLGALWAPIGCPGLDEEALAALLQAWKTAGNDFALGDALIHAVRCVGPEGARRVAAHLHLEPPALGALLRKAVARGRVKGREAELRQSWSLERDEEQPAPLPELVLPEGPGFAACLAWADELEGASPDEGRALDVVTHFGLLGRYDAATLQVAIVALAATDPFAPPASFFDAEARWPRELAGDVGGLADREDVWPHLRLLARHLHRLELRGKVLERCLAQLLGVSIRARDEEAIERVLAQVPEVVEWDVLAFNLACHHALRGPREAMLRWTQRALELGKSPSQFQSDDDFAGHLEDPELQALFAAVE